MDAIPVATIVGPVAGIFYSLLSITLALGIVQYYMSTRRMVEMGNLIPGPPTIPLLGNVLILFMVPPNEMVNKLREFEFYGNVVRGFLGRLLYVAILDARDIEIILGSHVHIDKSSEYRYFKPWLGEGLLISSGEKWRTHRKMIAPTFHLNILKSFVPLFHKHSQNLVESMRKEIGKEFDCHDYLSGTTVDILLETAMGIKDSKEDGAGLEYAVAVMKMCDIVHQRQYKFHLRPDCIFGLTNFARKQKKLLGIIHGLTNRVIRRRKAEHEARVMEKRENVDDGKTLEESTGANNEPKRILEGNTETPGDARSTIVKDDLDENDENDVGEKKRFAFLDLMLEAARNGSNLTDEEIKEEVDTIMFEGHDTTAAGSSFVLCMLGYHQDVQAEVCRELNDIFQGSERPATFYDTLEMKYLERVILETLRLFPPVPLIARKLTEDVRLASNDYVVPAGSTIIIPTFKVHRMAEVYPDPEKFNPDHFLPENVQKRHYYEYIPFSAGPRSCVGRKYAMLKLKLLISTILRNYKIYSDVPENEFKLRGDIILKRSDGFNIRIEPRIRDNKKEKTSVGPEA